MTVKLGTGLFTTARTTTLFIARRFGAEDWKRTVWVSVPGLVALRVRVAEKIRPAGTVPRLTSMTFPWRLVVLVWPITCAETKLAPAGIVLRMWAPDAGPGPKLL